MDTHKKNCHSHDIHMCVKKWYNTPKNDFTNIRYKNGLQVNYSGHSGHRSARNDCLLHTCYLWLL